jgi:hypothetical protein
MSLLQDHSAHKSIAHTQGVMESQPFNFIALGIARPNSSTRYCLRSFRVHVCVVPELTIELH